MTVLRRLLWLVPLLASQVSAQEVSGQPEAVTPPVSASALPVGALYTRVITPPREYARWYRAVEHCTGRRGSFRKVRWFVARGPWPAAKGGLTYGLWTKGRIVLSVPGYTDSALVMHEALHDILYRSGWRPPRGDTTQVALHPSPPFGTCAPATYPVRRRP